MKTKLRMSSKIPALDLEKGINSDLAHNLFFFAKYKII